MYNSTPMQGTNNSQQHRVDIHIYDDENEKTMKARRAYVFTLAASSLVWAFALLPYWGLCCSHTTLTNDSLHIGFIFLIITVVIVTAHSSQVKEADMPDGAGFKLLQMVQILVLLGLLAGTFIPFFNIFAEVCPVWSFGLVQLEPCS